MFNHKYGYAILLGFGFFLMLLGQQEMGFNAFIGAMVIDVIKAANT